MLRLAFDFIITWRETRTRPNAYLLALDFLSMTQIFPYLLKMQKRKYIE